MGKINVYMGIFLIFFVLPGCKQKKIVTSLEDDLTIRKELFTPAVEKAITEFVTYCKSYYKYPIDREKIYVLDFFKQNQVCYMRIRDDFYYHKKSAVAYTFYNDYLIVYQESDTTCIGNLIKNSNWVIFKDSIPKYKSFEDDFEDMDYEGLTRISKIVGIDSLEIVQTF
jgi:hypothetical protein